MFCSHCGKEVAVGAKFCRNCGVAVNSQPMPAEERQKSPTQEPVEERPEVSAVEPMETPVVERTVRPSGNITGSGGQSGQTVRKKGVPKPLIVVAAALVLFVGLGAVLSLFGDSSEPDSSLSDSSLEGSTVSDSNLMESKVPD